MMRVDSTRHALVSAVAVSCKLVLPAAVILDFTLITGGEVGVPILAVFASVVFSVAFGL